MPSLYLKIEQQKYDDKVILNHIDQEYPLKAVHGIIGENGAGKSTLFQCMAGLIPFLGERMIPDNVSFGYLPAELYMYPMITGKEFLQFYVTAKKKVFREEEIRSLNQFFELPLAQHASTYSTGMLKKLYLMGIILQQNDILILDEPFNGLDFKSSAFITALIVSLREQGHTIFVASHDIDHLFSHSDTLSLLKDKHIEFYPDKATFREIEQMIKAEAMEKVNRLSNSQ